MSPEPDVQILYQDDEVLIANKPPGCLVVNAPGRSGPTLMDRLSRQLGSRVWPAHRLDEETTGVIAFAMQESLREELQEVFREHRAERLYLALASRMPSPPAGRVESRLAVGDDGIVRSVPHRRGERAATEYHAVERRDGGVLLVCRLETGRRNQIRVHAADLGCPIVGDRKYGWRPRGGEGRPSRTLLHAWRLTLPFRNRRIRAEAVAPEPELAPPPADFGI